MSDEKTPYNECFKRIPDNQLRLSFSFGSLFDTSESREVFNEHGVDAYEDYLLNRSEKELNFEPGPALGLYFALKKLNNSIPNEVLDIKLGLVSRNAPLKSKSGVLFKSYRNLVSDFKGDGDYSFDFDYMALTRGGNAVDAHKSQSTELAFTTSQETANEFFAAGLPSIMIPGGNKEKNRELYDKKEGRFLLIADYDGVVGDVNSELIYQAASKVEGLDGVEEFRKYEKEHRDIPMEMGPLGVVVKKLGYAVEYLEHEARKSRLNNEPEVKVPFETIVVTARGASAFERFINTLDEKKITISQSYLMDGTSKNDPLKVFVENNKDANIFFIDDGDVHFNRSKDLKGVLSGLVLNDFNTGNIDLAPTIEKMKEKLHKKNNPQPVTPNKRRYL
jgi:5'-nucleotidase